MRLFNSFCVSLLCGSVLCLNLGCPASSNTTVDEAPPAMGDDHDHDAHGHAAAKTLPEAVAAIDHLADDIKKSFEADDAEAAHGPLHDIGSVLENAGLLVAKSELTDEQKKAASEALKQLMDAYGKVDAKMHGDEGADFADVSEAITAAIESLETATGVQHDH